VEAKGEISKRDAFLTPRKLALDKIRPKARTSEGEQV
jgi:hypothetical protein